MTTIPDTVWNRRYWTPPGNAEHAFIHMPRDLIGSHVTGSGWWELGTVDDYSHNTPRIGLPCLDDIKPRSVFSSPDSPSSVHVDFTDLAKFAEQTLGRQVELERFEIEVGNGQQTVKVPAYWVTPRD